MREWMHTGMVCYAQVSVYVICATDYALCGTGRRDGVRVRCMRYEDMRRCNTVANMGRNQGILMKNGLIKPIFGGSEDILYDGFRKCFVNCKFTFYITLSSYLKKVKIPKIRKNHSKM